MTQVLSLFDPLHMDSDHNEINAPSAAQPSLGSPRHNRPWRSPSKLLLLLTWVLGVVALRTTIPFSLLVINIALVKSYIEVYGIPVKTYKPAVLLWATLSLATFFARLGTSLGALSSSLPAIISLLGLSAISSEIVVITIWMAVQASQKVPESYARSFVFPTIWASVWAIVVHLTSLGSLVAWSPVMTTDNHRWILPIAGTAGVDLIVALWATFISQIITPVLPASGNDANVPLLDLDALPIERDSEDVRTGRSFTEPSAIPQRRKSLILFGILLTIMEIVPVFLRDTPLPISSHGTTQLTVGCALPSQIYSKPEETRFDDYLAVTKKMTAAHIVIWPEGAVRFENVDARDAALQRVREEVPGTYVGVSFEQETSGKKLNAFALVSPDGVVFQYEKRNLVPSTSFVIFAFRITGIHEAS